jgi:hypothetical protein
MGNSLMCCGGKFKTVSNIAKAYTGIALESLFQLEFFKSPDTDERTRICQQCEKSTWLRKADYFAFIIKHLSGAIMHFEDLSKLPELPKEGNDKGKKLFCMLCKCWVPAAARTDKVCKLGFWPKREAYLVKS